MNVKTLGRSLPASALRRWRGLRFRTRAILTLLTTALLVYAGILIRDSFNAWPARATLKTPGDTWPLAFSPDGQTFLTSGEGGITSWDVASGRKRGLWAIEGDRSAIIGTFSPDGRTFAAAVFSRPKAISIELIDTTSGRSRASLSTPFPSVYALRFVDNGRALRAFLGDALDLKEVVTWDVETGQETSTRPLSAPTKAGITTISADGRTMAIGPRRGFAVELWDLDADRSLGSVANLKSTGAVIWGGVGLTSDGRTLAVAREDGTIELWDIPTHGLRSTLKGHAEGFTYSGLRFSPDGRTIAANSHYRATSTLGQIQEDIWRSAGFAGRNDSGVVVLDIATGRRLGLASTAIHPFYSPDGRTIATRERDFSVKLRDLPALPK